MYLFICIVTTTLLGFFLNLIGIKYGFLLSGILVSLFFVTYTKREVTHAFYLPYIQIVLGISTGLYFKDWSMEVLYITAGSIVTMTFCLIFQSLLSFIWLHKKAKWSKLDSILAVYPGSLAVVIDMFNITKVSPKVMITHIVRLFLLTMILTLFGPVQYAAVGTVSPTFTIETLIVLMMLLISFAFLGRLLVSYRIPAPYLLVSMLMTIVLVKFGLLAGFTVPSLMIDSATIVLGILIGSLFAGISFQEFKTSIKDSVVVFCVGMICTVSFSILASKILDIAFSQLFLSYAPGGVETVTVISVASGLNIMFILSHHLIRILVLQLAPVLFASKLRKL